MSTAAADTVPFMTRVEVENRAADVLCSQGFESIPVDLIGLTKRLGIAVHNAKFVDDNIIGMIAKEGDVVTVLVNGAAPPFRKRFTIAHELGHHFLHLPGDGEFIDGVANLFLSGPQDRKELSPKQRQEIQANMFAAGLLMPEPAVRARWQSNGSIEALARQFNVTDGVMIDRLMTLGLV
jgi:Zn-dependent peptidase ImmA (M78 family)